MNKIVILYSGGLDSTLLYHWTRAHYPDSEIICIYYDYGNPVCKNEVAQLPGFVKIRNIGWFDNDISLLKSKIGEEYKSPIYIPGRNLAFAILAACQELPRYIFMGTMFEECHDYATDKNNTFRLKFNEISTYVLSPFITHDIELKFPFVENRWTKRDLIKWALDSGISKDILLNAHSCYSYRSGTNKPCGVCHACIKSRAYFYEFDLCPDFIEKPEHSDIIINYVEQFLVAYESTSQPGFNLLTDLNYNSFDFLLKNSNNPNVIDYYNKNKERLYKLICASASISTVQ